MAERIEPVGLHRLLGEQPGLFDMPFGVVFIRHERALEMGEREACHGPREVGIAFECHFEQVARGSIVLRIEPVHVVDAEVEACPCVELCGGQPTGMTHLVLRDPDEHAFDHAALNLGA